MISWTHLALLGDRGMADMVGAAGTTSILGSALRSRGRGVMRSRSRCIRWSSEQILRKRRERKKDEMTVSKDCRQSLWLWTI